MLTTGITDCVAVRVSSPKWSLESSTIRTRGSSRCCRVCGIGSRGVATNVVGIGGVHKAEFFRIDSFFLRGYRLLEVICREITAIHIIRVGFKVEVPL